MTHDFETCLNYSEGVQVKDSILDHLVSIVPGAKGYSKAEKQDDRNGTDYWIHRSYARDLSIDFKHRRKCPILLCGIDDVCIEVISVYRGEPQPPYSKDNVVKIGWSLSLKKQTDFIVYTWPTKTDSRRFWAVSFPMLSAAARKHWQDWIERFPPPYGHQTKNNGYWTINCYPLRSVVVEAIREIFEGTT